KRVFEFVDFITLDDGERPLLNLIEWMNGTRPTAELKRCFCLVHNEVMFCNGSSDHDIPAQEGSTPDYSDLWLDRYISVLEMSNPMHRLWSDGVWLKLTMAHGCYWKKCSFCDIGLPYIGDYQPVQAARIADRMNELIQQTGIRAFHFVDEAAPPVLMKELAIEIIKRKMVVSWWTNIRFEKSFTRDLCFLLKSSGCIGVSGGLEVASDRLLGLIRKGVSVEQVCRVNQHFREAGIMVHAYLMYGFPTQTIQETIDSMEMVRQMFLNGILQSAHWHRFALTVHSPVMANPSGFKIKALLPETSSFANNDVDYKEDHPVDHDRFGEGLRHSLQNYMQHFGLEKSLHEWFDFRTPSPSVEPDFVERIVSTQGLSSYVLHNRVIWMHATPFIEIQVKRKKGREWEEARLEIHSTEGSYSFNLPAGEGRWLCQLLANCSVHQKENPGLLFSEVIRSYEEAGLPDFDLFWYKKPVSTLYRYGLLIV
ncbi:MAG TPA: radical SAM protein, partial [Chitinophagaceae bacterium]|nr:radical SAM protein [Chitinophagaceae bacterium]